MKKNFKKTSKKNKALFLDREGVAIEDYGHVHQIDKFHLIENIEILNNDYLKNWKNYIGYVPQQIFLSDDTIAANIALGFDHDDIDQNSIEKAAKNSNIHEFIINELPNKYNTIIGEKRYKIIRWTETTYWNC